MAKNEFLPFAQAEGANVLSNDEYGRLKSRSSGFQAGVARSQELNKVWRQSSVIAHVIAQFIADNSGKDVLDDGDITKLNSALTDALLNKITENVPAATLKKPGIVQLSNDADSDNETMAATPKAIKAVRDLVNKISIDGMYPVGIVVWLAQNIDPNLLFPGTKWKYIGENRTVRLASADGSDVMTIGGADSVTLAVDNLPAHGHSFSANTSSFDYGTKATSSYNHGTVRTNTSGEHTHNAWKYTLDGKVREIKFSLDDRWFGNNTFATSSAGDHDHTINIGAHSHNVSIGAHSHSLSGNTTDTGSGAAFNVTNSFIKLMGWYRIL